MLQYIALTTNDQEPSYKGILFTNTGYQQSFDGKEFHQWVFKYTPMI